MELKEFRERLLSVDRTGAVDSQELKGLLLSVGQARLRNMPSALRQFEYTVAQAMQGHEWTLAVARSKLSAFSKFRMSELRLAEICGNAEVAVRLNAEATRGINERLVGIVDEWAQSHATSIAIEPLPQIAPVSIGAHGSATPTPEKERTANVSKSQRRNQLAPLIEEAQRQCERPHDAPAVWAQLTSMANQRRPPLLGICEDGIKWQDAHDQVKFLKLKNLRDRLNRDRARQDSQAGKAPGYDKNGFHTSSFDGVWRSPCEPKLNSAPATL